MDPTVGKGSQVTKGLNFFQGTLVGGFVCVYICVCYTNDLVGTSNF